MHLLFIVSFGVLVFTMIMLKLLQGEDVLHSKENNILPAKKLGSFKSGRVPSQVCVDKIVHLPVKSTTLIKWMTAVPEEYLYVHCAKIIFMFGKRWRDLLPRFSWSKKFYINFYHSVKCLLYFIDFRK